jgi:hypothetical protein
MIYILTYSYGDGTRYTVSGGADAIWQLAYFIDREGPAFQRTLVSIVDGYGSHIDYKRGGEMLPFGAPHKVLTDAEQTAELAYWLNKLDNRGKGGIEIPVYKPEVSVTMVAP